MPLERGAVAGGWGTSGKLFRVSVEMVGKGSVSQPFFKFPLIITPQGAFFDAFFLIVLP